MKGHVDEIVHCQISRNTPKRAMSNWLGELGALVGDKLTHVGLVEPVVTPDDVNPHHNPIRPPTISTLDPFVRNRIAKRAGAKALDPIISRVR